MESKGVRIAKKNFLKNNKVEGYTLTDFNTYCGAIKNKVS